MEKFKTSFRLQTIELWLPYPQVRGRGGVHGRRRAEHQNGPPQRAV